MTVSNQTNRTSVVGNAAVGQEVPFSFPITNTSDLTVYQRITATGVETTLVETTNYTVSISGDTGGTVTTVTAVAITAEIHIVRNTPFTQSLDLEQGGSFNAENIEDAVDKNTKLAIENKDVLDNKTLRFPETDASTLTTELPNAIDRASKVISCDSSGNITASSAVPTGSVSFTTFGTNMAEAANALAGKTVMNIDHAIDVRDYGAVCDGTTDDTAAIQAAIDAVTTFKHTANFQAANYTQGGGAIYIPGRCLVTATLDIPGGITFVGENPGKCGILFTPAAADTLFAGDATKYSRDATTWWTWVRFQNLHFVSDILTSENENICFDFTLISRWSIENCYIEEFGTGIVNTNYSFYSTVLQTEWLNNKVVLNQGNLGGPVTFLGGNMRHGATVWEGVTPQPTEFCTLGSTVTFIGTAFETGSMTLADYPTFVSIRVRYETNVEGGGAHCISCYSETLFPFVLHDLEALQGSDVGFTYHEDRAAKIKFSNFELPEETYANINEKSAPTKTHWDGGTLIPIFKNPNMDYGVYDWTFGTKLSYSTATNFITSRGVGDATFTGTDSRTLLSRTITAAELAPYKGRRLYFGALIYKFELTIVSFQAITAGSDPVHYKRATMPMIDYGNNWGLYVFTIAVANDNTSDFTLQIKATPENTDTSDLKVAGIWAWINGINTIPVGLTYDIEDTAAPTTGTWAVGDRVWNEAPFTGSPIGWECVVAGTSGIWKQRGLLGQEVCNDNQVVCNENQVVYN